MEIDNKRLIQIAEELFEFKESNGRFFKSKLNYDFHNCNGNCNLIIFRNRFLNLLKKIKNNSTKEDIYNLLYKENCK